ncbi:hypothetical protein [Nocardiopsis valliformis]|nr:hypothetical protein [Nocardiopsis valliformis]
MITTLLLAALALGLVFALLRLQAGPLLPDQASDLATLRAIRARQEGVDQ